MSLVLVDTGPLVAYFDQSDDWHQRMRRFMESFVDQFITTEAVITETMWLLSSDYRVQNELILHVCKGLFIIEQLQETDYMRVCELNEKYKHLPPDFADLSLIAISERLDIEQILSIDNEFDIYRRLRNRKFLRIIP